MGPMDTDRETAPVAHASCSRCATTTELAIENFLGGRLYCARCAVGIRTSMMAANPVCPHGRPVDLTAAGLASWCPLCAAGPEPVDEGMDAETSPTGLFGRQGD